MKIESKYDIGQKVYFLDLPFGLKKTCETVKIAKGKIDSISFDGKKIRYNIRTEDIYYTKMNKKHIFRRKNSAKNYIFDKYIKIK